MAPERVISSLVSIVSYLVLWLPQPKCMQHADSFDNLSVLKVL